MKNWGIMAHPKVATPPANTASVFWYWQIRQHWGMPLRAQAHGDYAVQGYYTYISASMTGGVQRRFDGIGGVGMAVGTPAYSGWSLPANNMASRSQTEINNISEHVLITEANNSDMGWGLLPNPGGGVGPMNYWLLISPAVYWAYGNQFAYCGAHSRKRPIRCHGGNNGLGGIQSICQGALPWPDGLTTYVATDGSAKAVPWRGGMIAPVDLGGGVVGLRRWWPN
jgi:hypothetical protein